MIVQPFSFLSGSAGGDSCGGNQGLSVTTSSGSSNVTYSPIYGLFDFGLTYYILTQSQMGSGQKLLRSIAWHLKSFGSNYTNLPSQVIKLAHIQESSVDTSIGIDDIYTSYNVSNLTTVYSGSINYANDSTAYAEVVDFDTNFCYNGSDNLMVVIENRNGNYLSGYGYTEGTTLSGGGTIAYYEDNLFPGGGNPVIQNNSDSDRTPNTKFEY